jgi:hypothetical protein
MNKGAVMAHNRDRILQILHEHKPELTEKFDVKSLAMFGSVARGTATHASDIDILVEYYKIPGLFRFIELQKYLEELTGYPVDLVTRKALKSQLRDRILKEAVNVT